MSMHMKTAPQGAGTPLRGLTHSLDYGKEGLGMQPTQKAIADRLWHYVTETSDGCWEYTGARTKDGYGTFNIGMNGARHHYRAHRAAWEVTHGSIPEGMFVCHRCDNPPCCNPDHLFLGTNQDNMRDMVAKGRHVRPRTNKLTPGAVKAIRREYAEGKLQREIAAAYGITQPQVSGIVRGIYWPEVS